jgi:hypothetical protein
MEQTSVATKPRPMPQCKVNIRLLIHNTKGCRQSFVLWAQHQYSSGHFIENASLINPSTQITEPMAVATQPSPVPCYKV